MIVAGMDWSMTCPAICIYDTKKKLTFNNCKFFYLTSSKKFEGNKGNVYGFMMPLYSSDQERFNMIAEWAMVILNKFEVKDACLEGYSMGSKGKVFNIAENIGLLKHYMWKNDIKFITPAPTAVKKEFTGKGNANKEVMYESLCKMNENVDLPGLLGCKVSDSPISDITDSFAMVHYFINCKDVR
jgi:Holliday junction resolvasome RuvABC endonuclease subunit